MYFSPIPIKILCLVLFGYNHSIKNIRVRWKHQGLFYSCVDIEWILLHVFHIDRSQSKNEYNNLNFKSCVLVINSGKYLLICLDSTSTSDIYQSPLIHSGLWYIHRYTNHTWENVLDLKAKMMGYRCNLITVWDKCWELDEISVVVF